MKATWLLLSLVLGSLMLTGCGSPDIVRAIPIVPPPEQIAERWYAAVEKFDPVEMYKLSHPQRRKNLEDVLNDPMTAIREAAGRRYFDMAYSPLRDGETARVYVRGKMANRLNWISSVEESIELRLYDGQWKVWNAPAWFSTD